MHWTETSIEKNTILRATLASTHKIEYFFCNKYFVILVHLSTGLQFGIFCKVFNAWNAFVLFYSNSGVRWKLQKLATYFGKMASSEETQEMIITPQETEMTQPVVLEVESMDQTQVQVEEGDGTIIVEQGSSVQVQPTVVVTTEGQPEIDTGTIISTEAITVHHEGDGSVLVPEGGQPVTLVSTGGEVGPDGTVTITMVEAVDGATSEIHVQQEEVADAVEQKVKIMSVTSGQTAAEQIAAALAEAVAGTEEEGQIVATVEGDEGQQEEQDHLMEDESSMVSPEDEAEQNQEPWNEEGCLVCNKDIRFDDPVQISKPVNSKLKEFFLEYLAVGDNVQLENDNVFPFCESCAADIEKLMNINRKIEFMHKEFNKLRDEVAKKAVKTFITRAKPDWLEDDLRTEAYGSYFPEGDKPKTHRDQLLEGK